MANPLDGLNPQQRAAAGAADGPLLIIAGPGTGKTKTLTARIAHLIASGVPADSILALTFTKKAAEEMRRRVADLVSTGKQPAISTFHALCHELLGDGPGFVNDAQRLQVIKGLAKPAAFKGLSNRELGLLISRAKNQSAIADPETARLVKAYNAALAELDLQDFDDLLLGLRDRLQHDRQAREQIQQRFRHILVDEFQDTNNLQYELLHLLRGHDNLFVIGDPRQSIYGFRGASGGIFDQFRRDFPGSREVTLGTNYRSVPAVVRLSNAVFADDPDLQAHSDKPGAVQAVQVLNEYSEANWILNEIQRAIGGGDFLRAVSDDTRQDHRRLSDFAILYRSRAAAATVQKLLADSGLPYQVVGEGSLYDHPQVQAVIALLRAAANGEAPELEGFPAAQQRLLRDLVADARQAVPSALALKLLPALGFAETVELHQLLSILVRFPNLSAALQFFDSIAEQSFYDPDADAITLLTIHASKGLEFSRVFLVGVEQGLLPHDRADPDEEQRLFYVAVTRAKDQLDILHAATRGGHPTVISDFIKQVDDASLPKVIDPHMADDQRRARKRQAKRSQQSLF